MLRREAIWRERRRKAAERRPTIRLDACAIEPRADGSYGVTIDGFNLHQAISPPLITVGGIALEGLQFTGSGRRIRGVLKAKPRDAAVVVDYGFVRAELAAGPQRPPSRPGR